jgi:DNA-binding transcriptional MerR regulator
MLREQPTLTISQAAEVLGVSPAWLRFGERLGSLLLARQNSVSWHYYTSEDLDRLMRLGVGEQERRLAGCDE